MIFICGTTGEECKSGPVNVVGYYIQSLGYLRYNDSNKLIYTDGNTEDAFYSITVDGKGRFILIHESSKTFLCFNKRKRIFKNIKRVSPSALEGCILEMRSQKVWIQIGYNITKSLDVRQFLQVRGKGKMAGRYQPRFIRNCMKRRDIHKVAHGKCNFVNMLLKRDLVVESCTDKQRNACRILKENKFPKKFGFCDEYDEY